MTHPTILDVQKGWKVFAGADEIGEVTDVLPNAIDVRHGTLIRHTYRIPGDQINEASDGVVDLSLDRASVEALEVDPGADDEAADALPDEYLHIEFPLEEGRPKDPMDLVNRRMF